MFYGRSGLVLTIITSVVASFVWGKMDIAKLVKFSFFVYIFIVCISCLQDVPIFRNGMIGCHNRYLIF